MKNTQNEGVLGVGTGLFIYFHSKENEERRGSLLRAEKIMLTNDSEEAKLYVL